MIRGELLEHHPNQHYNKRGKAKTPFDSRSDAYEYIDKYDLQNKVPYYCTYCSMWHVGRNYKNKVK